MDTDTNIDLGASCVLLWLPIGVTPKDTAFYYSEVCGPPSPNPSPWWKTGDAIDHASRRIDNYGKRPWIKVGSQILSPDEIVKISGHHPGWSS
jgi:hypothetical protein